MTDREYIIGVSTVETMHGEMVLVAIEDQDKMYRSFTDLRYNCYTYGNGKAYYWEKINKTESEQRRIDIMRTI